MGQPDYPRMSPKNYTSWNSLQGKIEEAMSDPDVIGGLASVEPGSGEIKIETAKGQEVDRD